MSDIDADKVDISSSDLKSSFKELVDEKNNTNWIAFSFNSDASALELFEKGEGGFQELKKKMTMNWASKVIFGCMQVNAFDHRGGVITSKRNKLIAFSYVGTSVPELQRAKTSFQKGKLLPQLFPATHLTLEIQGKTVSDITEISIAKRLHDSTAAHKPTHYSFGGQNAKEISVEEIYKGDDNDSDDEFRD